MIFEPLQNVQMSWSKFQVTSFIDFQTYLDYFHTYEGYLDKFMDEERVKEYFKYTISKVEQNLALSLGGYLWAISAVATKTLQIRCLLETHVVTIHPPLQIIYVGNRCEGFSSSVFIPAKSDQAVIEEIEPRQKYFLEFNEIYEPDQYIGLWYQFKLVLMNKS